MERKSPHPSTLSAQPPASTQPRFRNSYWRLSPRYEETVVHAQVTLTDLPVLSCYTYSHGVRAPVWSGRPSR